MPRQIPLDLDGEGLRRLWNQLPEHCRRDAIAIWTRLIGRAAHDRSDTRDSKEEQR